MPAALNDCIECGLCLAACPEAGYDPETAKAEIKAVNRGDSAGILSLCSTCMACTENCPNGADPFSKISALQELHGIALIPADRTMGLEKVLSSVPERIAPGDPDLPVLSLCVMEQALPPGLTESALFENLTVISGSPYYSRVLHLHTGMPSLTRAHAEEFIHNLTALQAREIVFAHDDCYVMSAVLAPDWGIPVQFTPVHLAEWLCRVLSANKPLKQPVRKAAFQRPCISRLAPKVDSFIDAVFDLTGVERVGRKYDRINCRCCGIGLIGKYPARSRELVRGNIEDALAQGAEAMIFGCPSCHAFMSGACMEAGLAPIFIADLARMAIGEVAFGPRPCRRKDSP